MWASAQKEGGWQRHIKATTDRLAAGHEELRKVLAEVVRAAVEKGWVDAGKAEGWLRKLERDHTQREGWPKYYVRLVEGIPMVIYCSTNPDSIRREAQRLKDMDLEEGGEDAMGGESVLICRKGLAYVAWLSVNGSKSLHGSLA